MKYKVGDEVYVKGEILNAHEGIERPYYVAPNPHSINWVSEEKIYPVDKTYEQGLTDAWELVRKLGEVEQDEREKMFSYRSVKAIIEDCTIEEVMDKIESYEQAMKITVGDVISLTDGTKALVVDNATEDTVHVLTETGCLEEWEIWWLKKNDKHIDLAPLLKQIGE